MKEEVYMTIFEIIHTYAFWKIMFMIWGVPILMILILILIYFHRRKKESQQGVK